MKIKIVTKDHEYQGLYYNTVIEDVYDHCGGVEFTHNGKSWKLFPEDYHLIDSTTTKQLEEYTGSSSSYYKIHIATPVTAEEPYDAECLDIIEALEMTWGEANVFKATWRKAAARKGLKKKGNTAVYDAEKMVFFSQREEVLERAKEGK